MNERIRELKYQAEALAYEEHKANCIKNGIDPSMPHANALNMTFEKFAELIVRECMSLMKERKDYYDNPGTYETEKYYIRMEAKADAFDDASSIIKNHFGVEE